MNMSYYFKTTKGSSRIGPLPRTGFKTLSKLCLFVLCLLMLTSSAEAGRVSKILNKDESKLKRMIKKA